MPIPESDRITPIEGEVFRLYVRSWTTKAMYLVDLAEDDFRGTCSCIHHSVRVVPQRREGKQSQCKHVLQAIKYVWPIFGRAFLKEMEQRGSTNADTATYRTKTKGALGANPGPSGHEETFPDQSHQQAEEGTAW